MAASTSGTMRLPPRRVSVPLALMTVRTPSSSYTPMGRDLFLTAVDHRGPVGLNGDDSWLGNLASPPRRSSCKHARRPSRSLAKLIHVPFGSHPNSVRGAPASDPVTVRLPAGTSSTLHSN